MMDGSNRSRGTHRCHASPRCKGPGFAQALAVLACAALVLRWHPAAASSAAEETKLLSSDVLRSASELDYPPFATVREDDTADGFSVDLLKAVAQAAGLKVRFTVGPWNAIKNALSHGRLDALPLVAYSEARDRVFDFTAPYLRIHGAIFVRKGETAIHSESDLKDKAVLVMDSDATHEYAIARKLSDRLILTKSVGEALRRLSAGEHDAVIAPHLVGLQLIKQLDLSNLVSVQPFEDHSLKPIDRVLSGFEQKFCIAVREGDKMLLARLNEGLSLIVASGEYDRLYDKWFGPILPSRAIDVATIARYLAAILVPVFIVLGLFGIWYLRREVSRQTRNLSESERRLSLAISATADAIWEWNLETEETYYSPRWYEMLGYQDQEFAMTLHTWKALCHPEDLQPTMDLVQSRLSIANDEGYDTEFRMRAKDGSWVWISGRGKVVARNQRGRPVLLSGTNTDITERKRAEASLRQLSQFPAENPYPVMRVAVDGDLLYANDTAARLLKALGWQARQPLPPPFEDAGRRARLQADVVKTEISVPDGRTFDFSAIQPSGEEYVNFYGMDVTERKQAEIKRFESDRRFRLALRNAPVSVAAQDLDLRYIWAFNQRTARPEDIIGHVDEEIFTPEEAATITAFKRRVLEENMEFRQQMWLDRPGGKIFIDVLWEPIRDENGCVTGVATATLDLTPIKLAEEQLKAAIAEKEILLKEVHHRVKNNMQVISSLVDLQMAEVADAVARHALQDMSHRVRSMAMVHEKLYQSSNLANVAFDDYARSLIGYLWRSHANTDAAIEIKVNLSPVTLPVNAAVPCGLILNELLSNAFKHAFPDGQKGTVTVTLSETDGREVCLGVSDTGRGMPTDLDWQHPRSLGLRLVQMLSQQLDGALAVTGMGGAAFTVTFKRPDA